MTHTHTGRAQIGPVQPGDHDVRVTQPEHLDDVGAHRRGSGGRQRDHRRAPQLPDQVAQLQVVGPEVVSPRGHAVRLVNRHQRRLERPHRGQPSGTGQLLRRDEQETGPPATHGLQRVPPLAGGLRGADPHRRHAGLRAGVEPRELVLLQREQWRHHHSRSVQDRAADLVDS
jgi:hypothetical protein